MFRKAVLGPPAMLERPMMAPRVTTLRMPRDRRFSAAELGKFVRSRRIVDRNLPRLSMICADPPQSKEEVKWRSESFSFATTAETRFPTAKALSCELASKTHAGARSKRTSATIVRLNCPAGRSHDEAGGQRLLLRIHGSRRPHSGTLARSRSRLSD